MNTSQLRVFGAAVRANRALQLMAMPGKGRAPRGAFHWYTWTTFRALGRK